MPFSQSISGLASGTKYYFCAIVSNGYGTGYGAVLNFTTPATAPIVNTGYASALTRTTGTLERQRQPGRRCGDGVVPLRPAVARHLQRQLWYAGSGDGRHGAGCGHQQRAVIQAITGLTANTTYYFCAIAQNSMGVVLGAVNTFTTPAAPTAVTNAATTVTTNSAYLNGTGNPNRANARAGSVMPPAIPEPATTSSARAHRSQAAWAWAATSTTSRISRPSRACRAARPTTTAPSCRAARAWRLATC